MPAARLERSDALDSGDNARVSWRIEPHIGVCTHIIEQDDIAARGGIESLRRESLLLGLEGPGRIDRLAKAQKQRARVTRQVALEMRAQRRRIKTRFDNERRHS